MKYFKGPIPMIVHVQIGYKDKKLKNKKEEDI